MAARPGPPPFAENTRESSPETRWQYTGSMVPLDCMPRPANARWKFVICVRRRAQLGQRSRVSTGVLEGLRSSAGAGGAAFLCVSYAVPPVGDLRWEPPQPPRPRPGACQAVQFAPGCPQLPTRCLLYPVWSEDCLYLNSRRLQSGRIQPA